MKGGMVLIEHSNLEEFQDPVNYDLEFDDEMDKYQFYLELARSSSGEVLELACGTGLTTIPLSKAGITMTGVDISSAMIAYARLKAKGLTVTFMEGDARTFESDKRFSMIYLTGNAFQAFLSDQDQSDLLTTVHKHLQPHGIFALRPEIRRERIYLIKRRQNGDHLLIRMEITSRYQAPNVTMLASISCIGSRCVIGGISERPPELLVGSRIRIRYMLY
jgi:trans-aconitate methyltransferase